MRTDEVTTKKKKKSPKGLSQSSTSGHTKKHHTSPLFEIAIKGGNRTIKFMVPKQSAERIISELEEPLTEQLSSFEKELLKETGLPAYALSLRGLREKEDLTQEEFGKKINVSRVNISHMERGKRPIGKDIAQRIAKKFNTDYRLFL